MGSATDCQTTRARHPSPALYVALGFDDETGAALPGGALAATPMARIREMTVGRRRGVWLVAGRGGARASNVPGSRRTRSNTPSR